MQVDPSVLKGINLHNRLTIRCVRCDAKGEQKGPHITHLRSGLAVKKQVADHRKGRIAAGVAGVANADDADAATRVSNADGVDDAAAAANAAGAAAANESRKIR